MLINNNKVLRCQCRNITNKKICRKKGKILYMVENKLYCKNHFHYYRDIYALKIQSVWRGLIQRRMLDKIYKRLPDDLQYKILYYVRRDTYQKRYIKIIKKAVEKRIIAIPIGLISNYNEIANSYIIFHSDDVINVCRLYNKYHLIINSYPYYINIIGLVRKLKYIVRDMANIRILDDTIDGLKLKKLYDTYITMEWLLIRYDNS